jgi:hypothetical protein
VRRQWRQRRLVAEINYNEDSSGRGGGSVPIFYVLQISFEMLLFAINQAFLRALCKKSQLDVKNLSVAFHVVISTF